MNINEQFDDESCGASIKTIKVYRVSDGIKINEILVDSENKRIVFYSGMNGYKKKNYMKNIEIIDIFVPKKSIKLNENFQLKQNYIYRKNLI